MIAEPNCFKRNCKHFLGVSGEEEIEQFLFCEAFLDGIPMEIAFGDNLHLEPFHGDGGIQYEKAA